MITTQDHVDYNELQDAVGKLLKRDVRDYLDSQSHYDRWCTATKKGKKDPDGEPRHCSRLWYAEYQRDPTGAAIRPAYCDFWHWWMDDIHNLHCGYIEPVCFASVLEKAIEDEEESWVIEVLTGFMQVLGDRAHAPLNVRYYW